MANNPKTLKIVAWSVAGAVLGGALVFYNFIEKDPVLTMEIGQICPDFTVTKLQKTDGTFSSSNQTFTLSQHRGKVVIINFWATWCQGCVEEMKYFNRFYEEYSDEISFIALSADDPLDYLTDWLNDDGWGQWDRENDWATDFSIEFAYDQNGENFVYELLSGKDGLPRTVVVDRAGVAVYEAGRLDYEELVANVLPIIQANE